MRSNGSTPQQRFIVRHNQSGYTLTDLGAASGDLVSESFGLSPGGKAAGDSSNPSAAVATLFSNGTATNVNTLNANVSVGNAVNDSGQVAGTHFYTKTAA